MAPQAPLLQKAPNCVRHLVVTGTQLHVERVTNVKGCPEHLLEIALLKTKHKGDKALDKCPVIYVLPNTAAPQMGAQCTSRVPSSKGHVSSVINDNQAWRKRIQARYKKAFQQSG